MGGQKRLGCRCLGWRWGGGGATCLGRSIATSVVSLLIEPAHNRRDRVKVFDYQQSQEGVGCGLHIVELLARFLPAVPFCRENPHSQCSVQPVNSSEKAQKKKKKDAYWTWFSSVLAHIQDPQSAVFCLALFPHQPSLLHLNSQLQPHCRRFPKLALFFFKPMSLCIFCSLYLEQFFSIYLWLILTPHNSASMAP